ncbi:MAG: FHA domain-containing protein [Isosphaeraceae bacterium]
MMPPEREILGILLPVGGGDPIPLLKTELILGRRPVCDIRLDFSNVSGKHCALQLISGLWHIRDLGSTNGTSVNGSRLSGQHAIMPDDEVGVATHLFTISYVPTGPEAVVSTHKVLDNNMQEERRRHSLMELAGLDTDGDKPSRAARPKTAPSTIERLSAQEGEFDDTVPKDFKEAAKPRPTQEEVDEEFLKMIEEEVKKVN